MDNRSELDIFWEIVQNPTLKRVLLNQPQAKDDDAVFWSTCRKFVDYQRDVCKDKKLGPFAKECG